MISASNKPVSFFLKIVGEIRENYLCACISHLHFLYGKLSAIPFTIISLSLSLSLGQSHLGIAQIWH